MPVRLAYDRSRHTDGGGAQLHRVLGIETLALEWGLPLGDLRIGAVGYAGVHRLGHDPALQAMKWNRAFHLHSKAASTEGASAVAIEAPTFDQIRAWAEGHKLRCPALGAMRDGRSASSALIRGDYRKAAHEYVAGRRIRHASESTDASDACEARISYPHRILDQHPELWDRHGGSLRQAHMGWLDPVSRTGETRATIAVHIRRGDLGVRESWRTLPDEFYREVLIETTQTLARHGVSSHVTVYSDAVRERIDWAVMDGSDFAREFIPGSMLTIEASPLPEALFHGLPSVAESLLGDVEALRALASADILIGSRSSFSFCAGVLSRGLVVMPEFWHSLPPSWVRVGPSSARLGRGVRTWRRALNEHIRERFAL